MKKVLLSSTALAAAGLMAGIGNPAQAAEPIQLSLGGYYQAFFTLRAQSDVDRRGVGATQSTFGNDEEIHNTDVQTEGEIFFQGETTLDNGVKVGVNVQLEGYTRADQIDEHYVYFSGDFGRLVIGAENSAPYTMHYTAPGAVVGHGLDSPNIWTMVGSSGNSKAVGSPVATPVNITSDSNKLTYFTPRFSPGFQFGFSYTPETAEDNGTGGGSTAVTDSEDNAQEHVIAAATNYVGTVSGVDVAWSLGAEHGFHEGGGVGAGVNGVNCNQGGGLPTSQTVCIIDPDNTPSRTAVASGFNVGWDGWTVGGAVRWDNEGQERDNDEIDTVLGVTYGAGPWLVGVMGSYAVDQDGETSNACNAAVQNNLLTSNVAGGGAPINGTNRGCTSDADQIIAGELGGTYTLGPGVRVSAALHGWSGWGDDGNENFSGVAFTMGTGLSF